MAIGRRYSYRFHHRTRVLKSAAQRRYMAVSTYDEDVWEEEVRDTPIPKLLEWWDRLI